MKRMPPGIPPLIAVERRSSKPLHRQIYDGYRTAIVDGILCAGQRVPSTRMLATDLRISRIPVLNAYAQLLAEGYFESRVGAGTVVSRFLPDQVAPKPTKTPQTNGRPHHSPRRISNRVSLIDCSGPMPWQRGWGAFNVSQIAFDHFPFQVWNSLVRRHCRNACAKSLDYGSPMGSLDLRQAIAAYLRTARAVRCEPEQIMIVSGSQQALEISTRVLLEPGETIWMEEPGYRFARSAFKFNGCQIMPVPVDSEGLNVAAGIRQYRNARAVLVTPSHQYPLGVTMSASRRLQLLDWAESNGSWIMEDDYDSEYRYESMPIASLQGLDTNARVVYIGTSSKVLFPALRLGYVVIPPDLVERFLAARFAMDISPAGFLQTVMADFIAEGHFARHLRRMRTLYAERRTVLIESINKEFGSSVEIRGGEAGMHLSLIVPGIRDFEIARRAAQQNLWLVPLSSSYISKAARQGFILGFGSTRVEHIPGAVRKLRVLIESK